MNKYEKPMVELNNELAEGVYAASGAADIECGSDYMNGSFHKGDRGQGKGSRNWKYKEDFGCAGCPANLGYVCALKTDDKDKYKQYDKKDLRPQWEKDNKGGFDDVNEGDKNRYSASQGAPDWGRN